VNRWKERWREVRGISIPVVYVNAPDEREVEGRV